MKIEGPRSVGPSGSARKAGGPAASGFSLPTASAAPAAPVMETAPTTSLDALLALQGETHDPRRPARQARRGRAVLDALDALMRANLMGEAPHAPRLMLIKLQSEIEFTGDPRLDAILAEIDLRAAVELAKLDVAEQARQQPRSR